MPTLEEVGSTRGPDKNQVFEAYEELLNKLSNSKPAPTVEEKKVVEEKKQVVETAVKEAGDGDELAKHVAALKTKLNKDLDDIEVKLLAEQKKFATLQQAITIQSAELNDLYAIRPRADTLAALLAAHKEKSVTLEQEINQKRAMWAKEQETHDNLRKDQEAHLIRTRQREEENYLYNRDIFRRKEQEEYELQKRQLEHELNAKRVTLEESFRDREAKMSMRETSIIAREDELQKLTDEVRNFPERILAEKQEAERILADKLQIKYEYEAKLLQKEFEVERQFHKQALADLEKKIEHLESLNYSFKPLAYNPNTPSAKDVMV
jgi:hypothetical protein